MMEDATETETQTEALSQNNDTHGVEEVNGDMDDLVDDLNKE